jgi:hypothetical protein
MKKPKSKPHKAKTLKSKIIQLTDIQFHSTQKRPSLSIGKKIQTAFETNSSGRIYNALQNPASEQEPGTFTFTLDLDPSVIKKIQEDQAKGHKVLITIPKGGIPLLLGEDTNEFLKSKNGKRLLRKIDKKKT